MWWFNFVRSSWAMHWTFGSPSDGGLNNATRGPHVIAPMPPPMDNQVGSHDPTVSRYIPLVNASIPCSVATRVGTVNNIPSQPCSTSVLSMSRDPSSSVTLETTHEGLCLSGSIDDGGCSAKGPASGLCYSVPRPILTGNTHNMLTRRDKDFYVQGDNCNERGYLSMILLDKYRSDYSGAHCQMILRAWCEMFIRILKVFGPSAPTGGGAFETTVLGPPTGIEEAFEATIAHT
ncbi:hypothetical protein GOBAR_AA08096 [Gossypium barbadense]|uniref:Uncharacterized protein n=1 Tax=Gossypium barbadense TaxID=3634 RepID=A0A2P5YAC7_GOSBA|nr:hypothetical protein GOBAR_AA08096 [Gossypium barbadense]